MPRNALALDPALDAVERDCLTVLSVQRSTLPHAANGQPRAPSDAYAAQVRKEMLAGRSREIRRVAAVVLCDVRDGIPPEQSTLILRRIIAAAEQEARSPRPREISAWNRAETRQDCLFDLAQLRVESCPDDPIALSEAIRECARTRALLDSYQADLERRVVGINTARLMPQLTGNDARGRHLTLVTE